MASESHHHLSVDGIGKAETVDMSALSRVPRACNNEMAMKTQAPRITSTEKGKLRFGLPGSAKESGERIKAAVKANRETLRRLAK